MNINKMRRSRRFGISNLGFWIVFATILVAASACTTPSDVKPTASPTATATASPAASATATSSPAANVGGAKAESLVGRWTGVEGTYLDIGKEGDKYSIEIANLDGPKTYEGTARGDAIEFTRNGKTETIKAGTGADTGMKGFEKETNCVIMTKGSEGFCRK
jgi:hypothetical protein